METKSGKVTVTFEKRLIPIAYDGYCCSVAVEEHSVDAALKGFKWIPGYLGFKFAEAASAKVILDGSGQEISFKQEKDESTQYLFAEKVLSLDDFAKAGEYRPIYDLVQKNWPESKLKEAVIYAHSRGVDFLHEESQSYTILINKQGQQLWPLAKP